MARITPEEAGSVNVCAFLDMLRWSENGPALLAASDDGYNVLVGSTPAKPLLFTSYAAHPNIYNPRCNSTAAGGYQFLTRVWTAYQRLLKLDDFAPINQDRAAIQILKEQHAYGQLVKGFPLSALKRVANIWASLPDAGYGQHEHPVKVLIEQYNTALAKYSA